MTEDDLAAVGVWRRKELALLKASIPRENDKYFSVTIRGAMVLCYSHWEGFFNELTEAVAHPNVELTNSQLAFRAVFARAAMDSLITKETKDDTIVEFLNSIESCQHNVSFSLKPLLARSNLNWSRLERIFKIYGVSWPFFNERRIFIEHQLCRIRHEIAHGNDPRLNREQVIDHIEKTVELIEELPKFFAFLSDAVWS